MATFSETIAQLISDYRLLLRKTLTQHERVKKLSTLNLKKINAYSGDITLYQTGWRILEDIEQNHELSNESYYSYSGITKYYNFLKELLEDHVISNDTVIHCTQYASNLLLEVIQLVTKPNPTFSDSMREKLIECNTTIIKHGSTDQKQLYFGCLERLSSMNTELFKPVLENYTLLISSQEEVAA